MLSIVLDILQKKCEANVIMIINDTLYLLYTFILSSNIYILQLIGMDIGYLTW